MTYVLGAGIKRRIMLFAGVVCGIICNRSRPLQALRLPPNVVCPSLATSPRRAREGFLNLGDIAAPLLLAWGLAAIGDLRDWQALACMPATPLGGASTGGMKSSICLSLLEKAHKDGL